MELVSYSDQLVRLANRQRVPIMQAIEEAGVDQSTYYRSIVGPRGLRYDTAKKIADAIGRIAELQ